MNIRWSNLTTAALLLALGLTGQARVSEAKGWVTQQTHKVSGVGKKLDPKHVADKAKDKLPKPHDVKHQSGSMSGSAKGEIPVCGGTYSFYGFTLVTRDVFNMGTREYIHKGDLYYGALHVGTTTKKHHVSKSGGKFTLTSPADYKLDKKIQDKVGHKSVGYTITTVVDCSGLKPKSGSTQIVAQEDGKTMRQWKKSWKL